MGVLTGEESKELIDEVIEEFLDTPTREEKIMNLNNALKEILQEQDVTIEDFMEVKVQAQNELDEENTTEDFQMHLKVKQLKKYLKDIPDDTVVCTERIEDVYFEKHGWKTIKIRENDYDHEFIKSFCPAYDKKKNIFLIYNHY